MAPAFAGPSDGIVSAGNAQILGQGSAAVTVNQASNRVVIDWQNFDTQSHESIQFNQPGANAIALNRITSGSHTQFDGTLKANGNVIVMNRNGVVFGQTSTVDVNGFIATTADIDNDRFMQDANPVFNKPGNPDAKIINKGQITAKQAGLVGFVAPQVINDGLIQAKLGKVKLESGDRFTLDLYGDGLVEVSASDAINQQLVSNSGKIAAEGGIIQMTAAQARDSVDNIISNTGILQASSASQKGGVIILGGNGKVKVQGSLQASGKTGGDIQITGKEIDVKKASIDASGTNGGGKIRIGGGKQGGENIARSETTTIDKDTLINADATENGNGGSVVVWSDNVTDYKGHISAKGGNNAGDGGFAEVSGKYLLSFKGSVNLTALHGKTGDLLLDPENLTIQIAAGSPSASCVAGVCTPAGDNSVLTVADLVAALGTSNVTLSTGASGAQAGNIIFADSFTWSSGNRLLVNAHKDITINSGVVIANTYSGTFGANDIPVLLALRADATGINNGGSFTNNGTINFSGSNGAVSIFYDRAIYGGSYTAGTQTAKSGWTAPTNLSLSSQFTAYQLVNTIADLEAMTSSNKYAIGKNIDGGNAAFNSNTPLAAVSSFILDGQYCMLSAGANCSITNLTLTAGPSVAKAGMFESISGSQTYLRNFLLDMDIIQNYTGSGNSYVGILAAETSNFSTIANVSLTGNIDYIYSSTISVISHIGALSGSNTAIIKNVNTLGGTITITEAMPSGGHTLQVGGLIGLHSQNTISNSSSAHNVKYIYKGHASAFNTTYIGGLIGWANSATVNAVNNSHASGNVSTEYFTGYTTGGINGSIGGLIGRNGAASMASVIDSYATGNVSHTLAGNSVNIGGLIGNNNSSTSVMSGLYATGNVSYEGSGGNYLGGLIGLHKGNLTTSYATGNVTYTLIANSNSGNVGGLVGQNEGSISNSYTSIGTVKLIGASSGTGSNMGYIGGLVGMMNGGATSVSGSTSSMTVSYVYKGTGTGTGSAFAGGLIGYYSSTSPTGVSNSSASGNVTAEYFPGYNGKVDTYLGGLIGALVSKVSNSFATGNVTSSITGSSPSLGGLAGTYNSTEINSGLYATGDVTFIGDSNGVRIGGFAGQYTNGVLDSPYATGNVKVEGGATSYHYYYMGGLVGMMQAGSLTNANSHTGSVTFTNVAAVGKSNAVYAGGLVGYLQGGTISGSTSSMNVMLIYKALSTSAGNAFMGGLVGASGSINVNAITLSSASGNVTANYFSGYSGSYSTLLGGLIGRIGEGNTDAPLNNSFATGEVSSTLNGVNYLGGVIAHNMSRATLSNLNATGNVIYTGEGYGYFGGLVGANDKVITLSSSTGNVTVTSNYYNNTYAGGFAGTNGGNISDSYSSTGTVSYISTVTGTSAPSINIGGLVGYISAGTISGSNSSMNVSYVHKGNSTLQSIVRIGGLVGYNISTTANSISNSNASGDVSAVYFTGFSGNIDAKVGGLIGQNGQNTDTNVNTSFATGDVTSKMSSTSVLQTVGGLIGHNYSTSTLSGLYATGAVTYESEKYAYIGGLVGNLEKGTISTSYYTGNMNIAVGNSGSDTSVGGLVGYNQASITNSYTNTGTIIYTNTSTGSIVNNVNMGGLVGSMSATGKVTESTSNMNVSYIYKSTSSATGTAYVGGLVGYNNSTIANSVTLSNASGNVAASYFTGFSGILNSYIGGLIGQNGFVSNVQVNNSFATGNVSSTLSGSNNYLGGLIGRNMSTLPLSTLYATGNVTYNGLGSGYFGGLMGFNNSSLTTSYSTGNVSVTTNPSSTLYIGGLIAHNVGAISNVSTNTGSVEFINLISGSSSIDIYMGGLVGYANSQTINNATSSMAVSYIHKGNGLGLATVRMGGLVGYNLSTTVNSISNSSASGHVSAEYFTGFSGGNIDAKMGGLAGQNGNSAANFNIVTSYATGNVTNKLNSSLGTQYLGGLLGTNHSGATLTGLYATGNILCECKNATVGGLIGSFERGTLSSAYATGTINVVGGNTAGSISIGGLAGSNSGSIVNSYKNIGTIQYSTTVTGSALNTAHIGGLVGTLLNTGTISGSTSSISVSYLYKGTSSATSIAYLGGLVGSIESTATNSITASTAKGSVTAGYFTGHNGAVSSHIGGLVGRNGNNIASALTTSFATGHVSSSLTGTGTAQNIGGLIGYNYSTSPTSIADSYATGMVTYSGNVAGANIGGLIGRNAGVVTRTYATGYVTASAGTIGGLSGINTSTITDSYWDTLTTGRNISAGGTGLTTTALQAALQTNWNSSTWGLLAGISYPYLKAVYATAPQVISGTAYDATNAGIAGTAVAGLINGSGLNLTWTGANGYYYFLLPNGTISSGGSQVLTYLTDGKKGIAFADNRTTNISGMNIYTDTINMVTNTGTLSAVLTNLATAQGGSSGGDFFYTNSGGLVLDNNRNLRLTINNTFDLNSSLSTSGTGGIVIDSTAAITQTAALVTNNLRLLGTNGSYLLNHTGNNIATLAANTGSVVLSNGNHNLIIGTSGGTDGITVTGNSSLNAGTGTITISKAISTGNGNLNLTADELVLNDALTGTGTLTLQPYTASRNVSLNHVSTGDFNLTTAEIGHITTGWSLINIGRTDSTGINIMESTTWSDPVTFRSGTNAFVLNGTLTGTGDAAFILPALTTQTSASAITTNNQNISLGNIMLGSNLSLATGNGNITFNDSVNGTFDLAVNASTINFTNAWGNITPLGSVTLNTVNTLALPSITATTLFARTSGAASDITMASGQVLNASGTNNALTLVAKRDFINNAGTGALVTANGRWLVYSTDRTNTQTDGLINGFNRYSCTYGGTCSVTVPTAGNGFIYTYTPTLTATASAANAVYGDVFTPTNYAYALSGYLTGDTVDGVTGSLTGTTTYVQGDGVGSYNIDYASGTLVSELGYDFIYADSTNALSVTPKGLTVTATNNQKAHKAIDPDLEYTYTGLVGSDLAADFTGLIERTAGETSGKYNILQGSLEAIGNYMIATFNPGEFTIEPVIVSTTSVDPQIVFGVEMSQIVPPSIKPAAVDYKVLFIEALGSKQHISVNKNAITISGSKEKRAQTSFTNCRQSSVTAIGCFGNISL